MGEGAQELTREGRLRGICKVILEMDVSTIQRRNGKGYRHTI